MVALQLRSRSAPAAPEPFRPVQVLLVDADIDGSFPARLGGRTGAGQPYGSALVLVRYHGEPLGTLRVPLDDGAVEERALRELVGERFCDAVAQHLQADVMAADGPTCPARRPASPAPFVSVVVATFRRPDLIVPCVESILASDHPDFEVVVVDNAPDDPTTRDLLQETFGLDPRVRYLAEPRAGTSFARNTGIAAAGADLIAITDDDVVVDRSWLANLAAAIGADDDEVACVTGLTFPFELETEAQVWFEDTGGMGQGFTSRRFALDMDDEPTLLFPFTPAAGASNNMMIRRSAVRYLRGFDVRLGPGTPTLGGEDLDLFVRVLLDRRSILYAPSALVWHRHRREVEDLRRHVYGYGVGSIAVLTKWFLRHPAMRAKVRRNALRLPGAFATGPAGPADARPADGQRRPPREIARARATGSLVGPFAWMRSAVRSVGR